MAEDNSNSFTTYEQLAKQSAGQACGSRYFSFFEHVQPFNDNNNHIIHIKIEDSTSITAITNQYLFCAFKELHFEVIPGPAIFGRTSDITIAYSHSNSAAPDANNIHQLPNATYYALGGASDPNLPTRSQTCLFNYGIRHMLKPIDIVGGKPTIYARIKHKDFGTHKGDGHLFAIRIWGTLECIGNDIILL